jgi:hypothetical protein
VGDILEGGAGRVREPDDLFGDAVARHPSRIVQLAEDQNSVTLAVRDDLFLDVVVDGCLGGGHEPGSHVDGVVAQRERGGQCGPVAIPPEAMTGTERLATAAGIRMRPGISTSPGCPAHSKPSMLIASTSLRSADRAWHTLVALWMTRTPA